MIYKLKTLLCTITLTGVWFGLTLTQTPSIEWAPIGAKWWYGTLLRCIPLCMDGSSVSYTTFEVMGDTIIDGKVVKQMMVAVGPRIDSTEIFRKSKFLVRQEDRKLLIYDRDSFRIVYDFSLQVGDTMKSAFAKDLLPPLFGVDSTRTNDVISVIEDLQTIDIDGVRRNKMIVRQIDGISNVGSEIIEGIGSLDWFLPHQLEPFDVLDFVAHQSLRCYQDKDLHYQPDRTPCDSVTMLTRTGNIHKSFPKLYPNPSKGLVTIQIPNQKIFLDHMSIVDLSGKKINLETVSQQTSNEFNILLPGSGVYFITYRDLPENIYCGKIIIVE